MLTSSCGLFQSVITESAFRLCLLWDNQFCFCIFLSWDNHLPICTFLSVYWHNHLSVCTVTFQSELTSFYEVTSLCLWTDLFLSMNWPLSVCELTLFFLWTDCFLSMNWHLSVYKLTKSTLKSVCYLLVPVVGLDKRRVVEALADKPGFLGKLKPNISNKQWNMHTYTNIYILFSVMYFLIRPSDILFQQLTAGIKIHQSRSCVSESNSDTVLIVWTAADTIKIHESRTCIKIKITQR